MANIFVIVCNRHKGIVEDALLFWSKDGGYTNNINKARFYSLEEMLETKIPLYRELETDISLCTQDFFITVSQLKELGFKEMTVYVR